MNLYKYENLYQFISNIHHKLRLQASKKTRSKILTE